MAGMNLSFKYEIDDWLSWFETGYSLKKTSQSFNGWQ
jgi:hypothetical protein